MKCMKRKLCSILALVMLLTLLPLGVLAEEVSGEAMAAAGDVEINSTNFPDNLFRTYVADVLDPDKNGILSQGEREDVTEIILCGEVEPDPRCALQDLTGIGYFPNLKHLDCHYSSLKTLDISKNLLLEELNCYDNLLTNLDVSKHTKLKYLRCSYNSLKALDVGNNPLLEELVCWGNELIQLDVRKNPQLRILDCGDNQLTVLDVTGNPQLQELSCFGNQLTQLDVGKNPKLEILTVRNNQLDALDISGNPELTQYDCSGNPLKTLDLSKNPKLVALECGDTQLKSLDVSGSLQLESLYCWDNELTELDVRKNSKLMHLYCSGNRLQSLDVSSCGELDVLNCAENQLTVLDVSKNSKLQSLNCQNNRLTSLDVSGSGNMWLLQAEGNRYTVQPKEDGTFDLSTLPGNFDVAKTDDWYGGTVKGNILTMTENKAVYTYNCGKGLYATFTLEKAANAEVERIYGPDRYETAVRAADTLKAVLGVSKFDNIVVASGANFADALAGSYLAAVKQAPILLVRAANVASVKAYIQENLIPGGTVYLLGGTNAVPKAMETGLAGFTVKRLGGATRYDTNLLILQEAGVGGMDIIVCTGNNFADSLSASAAGLPIVLVKDSLTKAQKDFLAKTSGSKIIVGGKNAVNETVEKQLAAFGTVTRLAGNTRYDTSVLVAKFLFPNGPQQAVLAYAQNFPDGLSGGPLAYTIGAPLILTANGKEAVAVKYTTGLGIKAGYVLGGPGLISDKVVRAVFSLADSDSILVK